MIVSEVSWTTRDAIDTPLELDGRPLVLIDTAGIRRRTKVAGTVDYYAQLRSERAAERADVALVVCDAAEGLTADDLRIAIITRDRAFPARELLGRVEAEGRRVARRLRALEEETGAVAFAADLTRQEDVDALTAWLAETGAVHALVQVAGGARGTDRVEDAKPADWQWMFEVNVLSAQRLVAALLPQLREAAASDGHADTLFVTSTAAAVAYPGGSGYNATKAAEAMIAHALRLELNGEPIRVTEVAPGTPAQELGLKKGDMILSVDEEAVTSTRALEKLAKPRQYYWKLTIRRDGEVVTTPVGG